MADFDISSLLADMPGVDPQAKQQALAAALRAKIQGPQQDVGFDRAAGNLGLLGGTDMAQRFGQTLEHNADTAGRDLGSLLAHALTAQKKPASAESNMGMWQALKAEYPDIAANYKEGELSDAAAGKIYMQASANHRVHESQTGADTRAHYTQGETNKRFEKNYGLTSQKQAADLGAREVAGAQDVVPGQHKPISQGQAETLAEMKAAADTVAEKVAALRGLYKKGGLILPGSTQAALLNQTRAEVFGPLLKTTGVGNLTVGHQHLLDQMMNEPGAWQNVVNDERFPAMLDELEKGARKNIEHQAKALGRTFSQQPAGGETKVIGNRTYFKKPNGKWAIQE